MEAKHLRIGNYIERHNKVTGVKDIVQVDGGTPLLAFEGMTTLKFNPIPLTEECLLKFGFAQRLKTYDCNFYENRKLSINIRSDYATVFLKQYKQDSYLISIEYVHQLQNLYFALTGEELEIK